MATLSKVKLSESSLGKQVKVVEIATAGTLIHSTLTSATVTDEVWIYAVNSSASSVKLTIEWGEATAPDGNIEVTILPEAGLVTIIPGLILLGDGSAATTIRAFAGTANVIMLSGYVNRITP